MKQHQLIFYLRLSLIGIAASDRGYCGSRTSGGCNNTIWETCCSVIGGGRANTIEGPFSGIFSGEKNQVFPDATHNFIGGGHCNLIEAACNVIGGGCANCTTGAYSAILGGSGNCDNGEPLTGIYGTGIVAANIPPIPFGTGAFWVNEIVVRDIPMGILSGSTPAPPPGYPTGSLWYYPDANLNKVVYVV